MLSLMSENMIETAISELKRTRLPKYVWGGHNVQGN